MIDVIIAEKPMQQLHFPSWINGVFLTKKLNLLLTLMLTRWLPLFLLNLRNIKLDGWMNG